MGVGVILVAFALMFAVILVAALVESSPPSSTPPPAPKTRAQIASEAYAVQAQAAVTAGRKTDPSNDCSGSPVITGDPPHNGGANIYRNSTWTQVNLVLTGTQLIHMAPNDTSTLITLTIRDSCIDAGGLTGAITVNDTTATPVFVWDPSKVATRIIIRNSTLTNADSFIFAQNSLGVFRAGGTLVTLDNVTMSDFNTTVMREHSVERVRYQTIHDSDVSDYNRGDVNFCAFDQFADDLYIGYGVNNTHFSISPSITTGCAAGDDVRYANGNYFDNGFLQLVFGSDFAHGVSPNFGSPTEFVNWSNNYANNSAHTVLGLYGTGTGQFSNHFGTNAYATLYHNYINNSRYIPIQSSGNQTGVRIIGNYLRGPSASGFVFAIGLLTQAHNYLVDRNYLWDMDSTNNVGIVVGFVTYNIVVSRNVMYDIGGNFIRVEDLGLKYRNETGVEKSDYSWKQMSVIIRDNYISGGTHDRAIKVSAGYVQFFGNTIVNGPPGQNLDIVDGWNCHPPICGIFPIDYPDSYVWVDWVDGFPDQPSIRWPSVAPANESVFWVRTGRTGSIVINGDAIVNVTSVNATHFGLLEGPRCVSSTPSESGFGPTDQEILAYTSKSCGPTQDTKSFTGPGTFLSFHPERWYNITLSTVMTPVHGHVDPDAPVVSLSVTEVGHFTNYADTNRFWVINPGHSYVVNMTIPVDTLGFSLNIIPLLIFISLLVILVIGALWLAAWRKRRSGL